MDFKQIQILKSTYDYLEKLKTHPRQPFYEVIDHLIQDFNNSKLKIEELNLLIADNNKAFDDLCHEVNSKESDGVIREVGNAKRPMIYLPEEYQGKKVKVIPID